LASGNFLAAALQLLLQLKPGIEAVSALSIPYGNDVHIPGVFGKWRSCKPGCS
jgi:hypothetical protein